MFLWGSAAHIQNQIQLSCIQTKLRIGQHIAIILQPIRQFPDLALRLQNQTSSLPRPRRCIEDGDDRLAAHTRYDDCISRIGSRKLQAVAQLKPNRIFQGIRRRRTPGAVKRPRMDIRRDHTLRRVRLQQPHRQIPVIGAHVGDRTTRRNPRRHRLQPVG